MRFHSQSLSLTLSDNGPCAVGDIQRQAAAKVRYAVQHQEIRVGQRTRVVDTQKRRLEPQTAIALETNQLPLLHFKIVSVANINSKSVPSHLPRRFAQSRQRP